MRDAPSGYGRGDGSPHPRGQRGVGRLIFPVFTGAGSLREKRVSGGLDSGFCRNDERERGLLADDGRFANRPYGGECCRARGSPPSPVFTRAGSNLPPSRGKGLVGAERAIFIVMTCFTKGDGFPPSREKREVGGMGDREGRSFEVRKRGLATASARTTGGGTVNLPRLHGGRLCVGKTGEWGMTDDRGGRSFGVRKRGWVPASARTTGGGTVNLPRLYVGRLCGNNG